MIKKFQIFEQYREYRVGDYVLYKLDYNNAPKEYRKAKIIKKNNQATFPYRIFDLVVGEKTIQIDKIIRHLTEDEIIDFETSIQTKKYNL